ncbi:hypothetical protein PM082_010161 [Marasmius tenuissimus]|nr:hypothetical protein PM082_010161 [Marasmius tenuissimus]
MTNHQYNARETYKANGTQTYISQMTRRSCSNLKKVTRRVDVSGLAKKCREKQAAYDIGAGKNKVKLVQKARETGSLSHRPGRLGI